MGKEYIDLDYLFESYMREKFSNVKGITPEQLRSKIGELYSDWAKAPSSALSGIAPADYYKDIECEKTLVEFLEKSCHELNRPNVFLLERIREVKTCEPLLRELVFKNINQTLTITAIELLREMNASPPLELYVELLCESFDEVDLREAIIEILIENADKVKESLFDRLAQAGLKLKIVMAEILINASCDNRTAALLTELFTEADDIPLISSYIGKYGDEQLIGMLYKALDTSNYMEFLELKNAIERMGGIVDDNYNFADDPYYKLIKS